MNSRMIIDGGEKMIDIIPFDEVCAMPFESCTGAGI